MQEKLNCCEKDDQIYLLFITKFSSCTEHVYGQSVADAVEPPVITTLDSTPEMRTSPQLEHCG